MYEVPAQNIYSQYYIDIILKKISMGTQVLISSQHTVIYSRRYLQLYYLFWHIIDNYNYIRSVYMFISQSFSKVKITSKCEL
jgi:hypothetical protein